MEKETFESDDVKSLHGRILKPVVYNVGLKPWQKKLVPGVFRNHVFASFLLRGKRIILKCIHSKVGAYLICVAIRSVIRRVEEVSGGKAEGVQ